MLTFAYYVSRGFFCRSFPSLTSGQHESMVDSLCLLSSAVGHSDSLLGLLLRGFRGCRVFDASVHNRSAVVKFAQLVQTVGVTDCSEFWNLEKFHLNNRFYWRSLQLDSNSRCHHCVWLFVSTSGKTKGIELESCNGRKLRKFSLGQSFSDRRQDD